MKTNDYTTFTTDRALDPPVEGGQCYPKTRFALLSAFPVEVGTEVFRWNRRSGRSDDHGDPALTGAFMQIVKLTKSYATLADGSHWCRFSGHPKKVGHSYHRLLAATDSLRAIYAHQQERNALLESPEGQMGARFLAVSKWGSEHAEPSIEEIRWAIKNAQSFWKRFGERFGDERKNAFQICTC